MRSCVFINLAQADERRRSVEASFAAAGPVGWTLERFEALGPADVASVPGVLSANEKACFASHRTAVGQHLEDGEDLFVVEDDVEFSPRTFAVLDHLLAQAQDWDVLFTDVALCDLALMVHLAKRRDGMLARGEYAAVNLAGRSFFGATAYAIRGAAKRKLFAALSQAAEMNTPYDLVLRDLCHSGALKFGACFPFVTSLASHADESQIQDKGAAVFDRTLNAYRRLMYADRDLDRCRRDVERLSKAHVDEVSAMVGAVFATIVSPAFPLDR